MLFKWAGNLGSLGGNKEIQPEFAYIMFNIIHLTAAMSVTEMRGML